MERNFKCLIKIRIDILKVRTFFINLGVNILIYLNGNKFLIKELYVKPKGILSLQKHFHRSEHWLIIDGKPMITLNKRSFVKKPNDTIYIT